MLEVAGGVHDEGIAPARGVGGEAGDRARVVNAPRLGADRQAKITDAVDGIPNEGASEAGTQAGAGVADHLGGGVNPERKAVGAVGGERSDIDHRPIAPERGVPDGAAIFKLRLARDLTEAVDREGRRNGAAGQWWKQFHRAVGVTEAAEIAKASDLGAIVDGVGLRELPAGSAKIGEVINLRVRFGRSEEGEGKKKGFRVHK